VVNLGLVGVISRGN